MLHLTGAVAIQRALNTPIDSQLKRLLASRRDQLAEYDDDSLLNFVVCEADDPLASIVEALGFSPLVGIIDGARFGEPDFAPPFEWVADHGAWLEAPIILSDDGRGVILIVHNQEGVDADLLALCRQHATPAQDGITEPQLS